MPLLDELSGFEFEDTMEVVFEKMEYENVQQSRKTADEGRDIIMEESNRNGPPTAVIVECKHTKTVGRPVVQKLDSAVSTYDHAGPKRGMIVTTGRFTGPAEEYADQVGIELMDGHEIREVADEIGMDLYNGRIEILCEEMLNPFHPEGPAAPIQNAFEDVQNISADDIPEPQTTLTLYPVISAETHVQRQFETGAGVISRINNRTAMTIDASRDGPQVLGDPVDTLAMKHDHDRVDIEAVDLEEYFDHVNRRRFEMTETEYRDWLSESEVDRHTHEVTYTGDNNVTYEKECEPAEKDVEIQEFSPVYAPRIYASVVLQQNSYAMDWFGVGDDVRVMKSEITDCLHCQDGVGTDVSVGHVKGLVAKKTTGITPTYCSNCGAIACQVHTRTEAVSGDPVCIDCAVTDRFVGAKKYFYDQENKEQYDEAYDDREVYTKPLVNWPGVTAVALIILFVVLLMLL